MIARLALPADESKILDLCRDALDWHLHTGQTLAPKKLNWPKVESMVRGGLNGQGVIGIIDDGDRLSGMIGLISTSSWYSDDQELDSWFTYVTPGRRGIRQFDALMEFAKAQARRMQIPVWLGYRGDTQLTAKFRAYSRHAPVFGALFRFDPSTAS